MSMMIYSLAGGVLSFIVMLLVKKTGGFSITGVSIAGGVSHNIGQLAAAMFVVKSLNLSFYLPVLMIAGLVTGFVIGVLSCKIIQNTPEIK
jgi:heptaprenyl diphosphate synthase